MSIHNLPPAHVPVQLSLATDETEALLQMIPVERLHYLDQHVIFSARAWLDERGPSFTPSQRSAIARIHAEVYR